MKKQTNLFVRIVLPLSFDKMEIAALCAFADRSRPFKTARRKMRELFGRKALSLSFKKSIYVNSCIAKQASRRGWCKGTYRRDKRKRFRSYADGQGLG